MEDTMPEKKPDSMSPYSGGMFQGLSSRIKLIFRLMGDPRVSPLLKLIPVGSLVYLVFPDIAPGPVDDALIIWLSTYLFVELCPPDVVQEHSDAINKTIQSTAKNVDPFGKDESIKEDDIIEGEIVEGEDQVGR
jgi:hypothetical protein